MIVATDDLTPQPGIVKFTPEVIQFYIYDKSSFVYSITLDSHEMSDNTLYLNYAPSPTEQVKFSVIHRDKASGATLTRKEYSEIVESTISIEPETINGYVAVVGGFKVKVTPAVHHSILYVDYEKDTSGGLFQDTIPLDKEGWAPRDENGMPMQGGEAGIYTVGPSGIFLWDGKYYIVMKKISDSRENMHGPTTYLGNQVLEIHDKAIIDYDVEKEIASEWNGSMYHGRIFLYKGSYYAYRSIEPLKSPDERPDYWYKIP